MTWKAILPNDDKLKNKLTEIAEIIFDNDDNELKSKPGLMGGKAGAALFCFYYHKFSGEERFQEKGYQYLQDIIEDLNSGYNYHTFCDGIGGIAWLFEHLKQNKFITAEEAEINDDLDDYINQMMLTDIKNKNYDFLHGGIGNAIHMLQRKEINNNEEKLKEFIQILDEISIKEADGAIKWRDYFSNEGKAERYNLSVSHGMTSIISFLTKAYEKGIEQEKVKQLAEGAIKFLFNNTLNPQQFHSRFPATVGPEEESHDSRIAWCYGDPGMGIVLWQAAKVLGDEELEKETIEIMLKTTKRNTINSAKINDAGLCHGTAGAATIYQRFYAHTGLEEFKQIAAVWLKETYSQAIFEDGYAGYKIFRTEEYGGSQKGIGLLEGIAGIGLAILSGISNIEPKWDSCFLLSS